MTLNSSQMAAITKMEIFFGGSYYNSDDHASAFDWSTEAASGIVIFDLGSIATITAERDKNTELIVYSPDNPDGAVWGVLDLLVIDLDA